MRVEQKVSGWRDTALGDVGIWLSGGTPSKTRPDYWNGDVPWLSPKDMKQFDVADIQDSITEQAVRDGARTAEPGSIFIVVRGMILAHTFPVCIAKRRVAFNQDVKALFVAAQHDGRFLAHWLAGNEHRMLGLVSEATHGTKKIELPLLLGQRLACPPLPEQRAIAAVLDTIDDAIQKTEQIIAKLQQVKQGLLHDLLTRGIDDNGELRDPERHPEQFQDSPLGRIPKGWRIGSVGEFCEVYNYLREPISEELRALKSGPFPYYGPTGILDYINEWRVEGEFVLIGEDGDHFLKFASWPMTQLVRGQFNVNNHAHILCGKADCRTHWIDTFFRHRDITLHTTRQGAGRFKLNKAALLTLPILVPSPLEQDSITADFQNAESQIGAEAHRLAKLRVLKAGLADDLLTGRVRTTSLPELAA